MNSDDDLVYYEAVGGGTPIVLCHGLGGNGGIWFQQVPEFARDHYVIVVDQRGFGRSTDRHERVGPETAVDDLVRVLDHLEVESAHVVGQSMGGWAALGLALRDRRRVRSLILSSTTGGLAVPGWPETDVRPRIRNPETARPLGEHPALGHEFSRREPELAYLYQVLGSFGPARDEQAISEQLAASLVSPDDVTALKVPTLFLAGEYDQLFPPAVLRRCAELVSAEMSEFAGCGHSAYFEDAAAWNARVRGFLS